MPTKPSYSQSSLYYNTAIDSQGRLGIWVPRAVAASTTDQLVTIDQKYNQRPDLMAHDIYGDARLWWIFAQRNPNALARDPLGNFTTGLSIYVPDPNNLRSLLGI